MKSPAVIYSIEDLVKKYPQLLVVFMPDGTMKYDIGTALPTYTSNLDIHHILIFNPFKPTASHHVRTGPTSWLISPYLASDSFDPATLSVVKGDA